MPTVRKLNRPAFQSSSASSADEMTLARVIARALAESTREDERLALARTFCFHVVAAWWGALTKDDRAFPLRGLIGPAAIQDLANPAILVSNVANRVKGFEIDPFAAWHSQVTLDVVMLPICKSARRRLPLVVSVTDSLRNVPLVNALQTQEHETFDLVIGNPPYGRVPLSPEVRNRFRRSLHGHANLYGLFTDLALRYTRRRGVIAYVSPTSFLAGEYFKNLRALLGTEAPPATIDLVAARRGVFEDVLQETLLVTYKSGASRRRVLVTAVTPTGSGGLRVRKTGSFARANDPSRPWLLPRTPEQSGLIDLLRTMPHRLADWGYAVSTGPLVWNRFKPQLKRHPGRKRFPLIWAESVTSDGKLIFRADKKNHEPYFEIREVNEWLITRAPCVLVQRTTAKEQHRRLIVAALPKSFLDLHEAVVIENHLNMVRPTLDKPAVPATVLADFDGSPRSLLRPRDQARFHDGR